MQHLINQLQLYILQEYSSPQSWLEVSRESYLHYRAYAKSRMQEAPKIPETEVRRQETEVKRQEPVVKRQEPEVKIQKAESKIQEQEVKNPKIEKQNVPVVAQEKPAEIEKQNFSDIQKIIVERFPEQVILPHPPDDSFAKTVKNAWNKQSKNTIFLNNLCQAIKIVYGVHAEVANNSLRWGEDKKQMIDLAHLDVYLNEPKQKANLWATISQKMTIK